MDLTKILIFVGTENHVCGKGWRKVQKNEHHLNNKTWEESKYDLGVLFGNFPEFHARIISQLHEITERNGVFAVHFFHR